VKSFKRLQSAYALSRASFEQRTFPNISQEHYQTILPAALGPGVYSASNRNEYQKQNNNVSGE
jgi:hypothetical protein